MTAIVGIQNGGNAQSSDLPSPLMNAMEVYTAIAQENIDGGTSGGGLGNVIISPFGQLIVALIQLQMQNTEYFKESAAETAARLQAAAEQQANAETKQFLSGFANALQTASQTGELPQIQSPNTTSIQSYTRTGLPVASAAISNSNSSTTSTNLSQLFTMLTSQLLVAQKSKFQGEGS
jgi:hypothetical protein